MGKLKRKGDYQQLINVDGIDRLASGDQLRDYIRLTARKRYGNGNFANKAALLEALRDEFAVAPEEDVDLDDNDCAFDVVAVPVTQGGLGLGDFGHPLNHGLIHLKGMPKYKIIEMGTGTPESAVNSARHTDSFTCSYVQFANLMVQGYIFGGGHLVSVVRYDSMLPVFKYHGWGDSDCWHRVKTVCKNGPGIIVNSRHEEDTNQVNAWLRTPRARMLCGLGFADPEQRDHVSHGDL